uniref:Putative LOC100646570 [Bombus terrestris] n=1 Tax=Lepeophtheirus salmonis TaxID=72036 RepID=A0A0K2TBN9_LEPSM
MMNKKESESSSVIQEDLSKSTSTPHPLDMISVTVAPFTGGPFLLRINKRDSVEELKKAVAKKLKVLKDRICLLYRESQLSEGSLEDNYVSDGARITLLPRAETGLLAQKPEQSVMQALESLNDSQVNDFLSGKAPLNLTMRLGDHMMLIQLQLSTVNAAAAAAAAASVNNKRSRSSLDSRWSQPSTNYRPKLDTRALAEASKNLTQTLKQLSSEVLTNKQQPGAESDEIPTKRPRMSSHQPQQQQQTQQQNNNSTTIPSSSTTSPPTPQSNHPYPPNNSNSSNNVTANKPQTSSSSSSSSSTSSKSHSKNGGAIIESMHHHGKGVYSGTFSGTLNPALQDKNGQPKRDITTIIHILNDLLCAQYKNYNSNSAAASVSARKTNNSSTNNSGTNGSTTSNGNASAEPKKNSQSANSTAESTHRSTMEQLQVTRDKMEQLRRVMEERKARRRARREARAAPYSTSWSVRSSEENNVVSGGDNVGESPSASSSIMNPPSSNAGNGSSTNSAAAPKDSQLFEPETVTV